jgi:hypothetical protein
LSLKVLKPKTVSQTNVPSKQLSFEEIVRFGFPQQGQPKEIKTWKFSNMPNLWRGVRKVALANALGLAHAYGQLSLTILRADGSVEDLGLVSCRVVTDTGVGFIVDAFENLVEPETMKYHGLGTGTTAEAASQTGLVTELSTAYNPDNTRATGSTTETSANIYRTIGTNTLDASASVTEHGVFSQAATGGGVMLDRSVFTAVALASGDSLQSTYDFTINSGG